jgi:hypothetical protein
MHSIYLLTLFPVAAFATLYGHCTGAPAGKATGDYLADGICDYTTDCTARDGSHISGGCPYDDDSITCCLIGRDQSYLSKQLPMLFIAGSSCDIISSEQ